MQIIRIGHVIRLGGIGKPRLKISIVVYFVAILNTAIRGINVLIESGDLFGVIIVVPQDTVLNIGITVSIIIVFQSLQL